MSRTKRSERDREVAGRYIDYLGYNFYRDNVRMRKGMKKRFAKKAKKATGEVRRQQVLASYWGWCKWGDCRHLWKKITNNDMSFADKGIGRQIKSKDKDGKRVFDVPEKKIMDILNMAITVIDFEDGITTKLGQGRCAVLFSFDEDPSAGNFKFLTGSLSLKDTLNRARAAEKEGQKIFPVENVVVKRKNLGDGKISYYFD